jgi:hypothetical protein
MIPAFTSLRVYGKKIGVKFLNKEKYRVFASSVDASPHTVGLSQGNLGWVVVKTDQCFGEMQDTLLHEILHVIDYNNGTEMTEQQVKMTATGLLAVLKDNKEFAKWLIKE